MRSLPLSRKLALSALLLLGAAGVAGIGTYATFTDQVAPGSGQSITAGTVDINLGADGGAANRLTIGATGVVPGDTIQRQVRLINAGNQNLSGVTLTTAASPSNLLSSDTTNGLQMVWQKCDLAGGWTESGGTPYTYTCPGGNITTVLASGPIVGTGQSLSGLEALTAGDDDYLRLTVTLPATAGNLLQGLTTTITYTFDATQRAATDK